MEQFYGETHFQGAISEGPKRRAQKPDKKVPSIPFLVACRKYAVSDTLEDLCCYVVDNSVDALQEGPQLMDSKELVLHIFYRIIGSSVYGTKYVDHFISSLFPLY